MWDSSDGVGMFANLRYFLLPVLNITGPVLIAFACLLLLPVFVSSLYNDGAAYGFEIAFVLCLITGLTQIGRAHV